MNTRTCETCGVEYGIGDYPFCKGGHKKPAQNVIDDQLEGGPRFFENFGHDPIWVETKTELRALLDAHNLRLTDKWAGPYDKHLTRWDAVDPYTLKNAEELVARVAQGRRPSVATDAA